MNGFSTNILFLIEHTTTGEDCLYAMTSDSKSLLSYNEFFLVK